MIDMILELWIVGEFPDDMNYIAGELKLNPRLFKRVFKLISNKFTTKDGVITHSRVTEERLKLNLNSEKARKSANIRWDNDANAKQSKMRPQSHSDSDTDSELKELKSSVVEPPVNTKRPRIQTEPDNIFLFYFYIFFKSIIKELFWYHFQ